LREKRKTSTKGTRAEKGRKKKDGDEIQKEKKPRGSSGKYRGGASRKRKTEKLGGNTWDHRGMDFQIRTLERKKPKVSLETPN